MKKKRDERDWHEKRIEEVRRKDAAATEDTKQGRGPGRPESAASRETFTERTRKPGDAGLANEARPGLGSRTENQSEPPVPASAPPEAKSPGKPKATPHGYEEPRPAPRDQPPDTRAHEEERSTGVSGQSGGV
jgi:hypothetical protein